MPDGALDAAVDPRHGDFFNNDLARHHLPRHADVPAIAAAYRTE